MIQPTSTKKAEKKRIVRLGSPPSPTVETTVSTKVRTALKSKTGIATASDGNKFLPSMLVISTLQEASQLRLFPVNAITQPYSRSLVSFVNSLAKEVFLAVS